MGLSAFDRGSNPAAPSGKADLPLEGKGVHGTNYADKFKKKKKKPATFYMLLLESSC